MPEYRTPDEHAASAIRRARVRHILDHALADAVSCKVAMDLAEPRAVVDQYVNRIWNGLRAALTPEDRIDAILVLLDPTIRMRATAVLEGLAKVAPPAESGCECPDGGCV